MLGLDDWLFVVFVCSELGFVLVELVWFWFDWLVVVICICFAIWLCVFVVGYVLWFLLDCFRVTCWFVLV